MDVKTPDFFQPTSQAFRGQKHSFRLLGEDRPPSKGFSEHDKNNAKETGGET